MASILLKGSTQFLSGANVSKHVITSIAPPRYLTPTGQAFDGANLKEVKARIKSVTSIRKITKTMNMIATARLRAAQARMERARAFYATVGRAFENPPAPTQPKKTLVVTISSDRGLCGAINTSVVKTTRILLKENDEKGLTTQIACIGEKAPGLLGRDQPGKILWQAGETSKRPLTFLGCSLLAERLLKNEFDTLNLIYNKFNTIISYTTTHKVLPSYDQLVNLREAFDEFEFEDDNSLFHLQDLSEYHLASLLYGAYSDAVASELGGRMSSMDSATRNAGDMIKKLTVEYNRKRQAAITTELNEIISGASAIA